MAHRCYPNGILGTGKAAYFAPFLALLQNGKESNFLELYQNLMMFERKVMLFPMVLGCLQWVTKPKPLGVTTLTLLVIP